MLSKEQIDNWDSHKLQPMDYGRIVSAKKVKGSGLSMGELVMVLGTKEVPASSRDPYIKRTLVTVVKLLDGLPLIPKYENDYMAYLVDPRSLQKVVGDEEADLKASLKAHYGG